MNYLSGIIQLSSFWQLKSAPKPKMLWISVNSQTKFKWVHVVILFINWMNESISNEGAFQVVFICFTVKTSDTPQQLLPPVMAWTCLECYYAATDPRSSSGLRMSLQHFSSRTVYWRPTKPSNYQRGKWMIAICFTPLLWQEMLNPFKPRASPAILRLTERAAT